jgi:hypothetical protein
MTVSNLVTFMTAISDFIDRCRPAAALTIQCGKVIYDGYIARETYREIANQNEPATLRQKIRLVFSLTNLTSSVVTLAYQPESVIRQSSLENGKCNHDVRFISDLIDIHSSAGITEDQAVLHESLESCRTCVARSTSQYQSSHMVLLTIQMVSLLMLYGSRRVENNPTTRERKFTISTGLEMLVMVDLLSKIYSDSALKPQKYLALVLRSMKIPKSVAHFYLYALEMQRIHKLIIQQNGLGQ